MSESNATESRTGSQPTVRHEEPPDNTRPERYAYASLAPPAYMETGLFGFRESVGLFGGNAPPYTTVFPGAPEDLSMPTKPPSWDYPALWTVWSAYPIVLVDSTAALRSYRVAAGCDIVLDRVVRGTTRGSWVVLELPNRIFRPFWVDSSFERVFTGFTLASRATALRLRFARDEADEPESPSVHGSSATNSAPLDVFTVRETTAHVVSEKLRLASTPDPAPVSGAGEIELETRVDGLAPGQSLFLRGRGDRSDAVVSEFVTVGSVRHDALGRTWVTPAAPLRNAYERASLVINANVVEATHGETIVDEVLGSGDASVASQRFTLRRERLSHRADDARDVLSVRVDGVAWRRAASPLDASPPATPRRPAPPRHHAGPEGFAVAHSLTPPRTRVHLAELRDGVRGRSMSKKGVVKSGVPVAAVAPEDAALLFDLRALIETARGEVARAVNSGLVMLHWHVGARIRNDLLRQERAPYGKQVVALLAQRLTAEFGAGVQQAAALPHDPLRRSLPRPQDCLDAVGTIGLEFGAK